MTEIIGNLWSHPADYRVVPTNGTLAGERLVMGAGVARQARDRFPGVDRKLGDYVARWGNRVFILQQERLVTFPTKHDWRDASCPALIRRSAGQLVELADKYDLRSVALPRVGCGLGGLRWSDVRTVLASLLDDRFVICS